MERILRSSSQNTKSKVTDKFFAQDFSWQGGETCSREDKKVVIFDFDCTITGNDTTKESSLSAKKSSSFCEFPSHHFYYATHNEEYGRKICQIFTEAELQGIFPQMYPKQIDWCRNFFGSKMRLQKLGDLFKIIISKGFKIIILTRGCSWHVGCMLRVVGLLKYITSIGGDSSVKYSTLWLNIIDNNLVIDATKNYFTKDREILRLLDEGFMVRYIDDDPEEHLRILNVINESDNRNYNYGNIGKSASICRDDNIRKNCIKFPDFIKNGNGMTIDMMSKLIKMCN